MAKRSKNKNMRLHAQKRAKDRLGINISRQELEQLVKGIQAGKYKPIAKQSNRVTIFEVQVRGETTKAVYDKQRKLIVSFLSEDMNLLY